MRFPSHFTYRGVIKPVPKFKRDIKRRFPNNGNRQAPLKGQKGPALNLQILHEQFEAEQPLEIGEQTFSLNDLFATCQTPLN